MLAATIALLFGLAFAVAGRLVPPTASENAAAESAAAADAALEERLLVELKPLFPDDECVGQAEAERRIRVRLDQLGLTEWNIRATSQSLTDRTCVSAAVWVDLKSVDLLGALPVAEREGGPLSIAMAEVRERLLSDCLKRNDAIRTVAAKVESAGLTDYEIRADPWGPQGAPVGQIEVYRAHVAAGCFVFVGGQFEEGTTIIYLWGPWP